jgi:uncharacterized protein (TIGR02145 family)
MKTKNYFLIVSLLFMAMFSSFGVDYTITFTGTGASTSVESVDVTNLTTGETITVPAGNTLHLTSNPQGIKTANTNDGSIYVSRNASGTSTLNFFAEKSGNVQVNVYSLDGRKITGTSQNLPAGQNTFQLSLPRGIYAVRVLGVNYSYQTKYVEQGNAAQGQVSIVYSTKGGETAAVSTGKAALRASTGVTDMLYVDGQRLLYVGHSEVMATVLVDVPMMDSEMEFYFVGCTDGSGNHYKVVQVGMQLWMAENLKTTKYNDGTDIPLGPTSWSGFKTPAYGTSPENNTFYNWFAASNPKIVPTGGWRVPLPDDWNNLRDYVAMLLNDSEISAALAANTGWSYKAGGYTNVPGRDLTANNMTGFSAIPTGYFWGSTTQETTALAIFWTNLEEEADPTKAHNARIFNDYFDLFTDWTSSKEEGESVRCVMDMY